MRRSPSAVRSELLQKTVGDPGDGRRQYRRRGPAARGGSISSRRPNVSYEHEQMVVIDSNEGGGKSGGRIGRKAALLSAKFALEDSRIWSPINGIVANRQTRVGEYVTAGTHMRRSCRPTICGSRQTTARPRSSA